MKTVLRTLCIIAMLGATAALAGPLIPEPPPPTRVDTPSAPSGNYVIPERQPCKDLTVQYVCGTEQKCDDLKGRGIVCTEVEKYCTRTERVCP